MESILPDIYEYFQKKDEHFIIFHNKKNRNEGWVRGELMYFLKGKGIEFDIEVDAPSPEKIKNSPKIDFKIPLNNNEHFVELKAPCICKGRSLSFYFGKGKKSKKLGLIGDIEKLNRLESCNNKWVILFFYPRPDLKNWDKVIKKLPKETFTRWQPITNPTDFDKYNFFVSVWKHLV